MCDLTEARRFAKITRCKSCFWCSFRIYLLLFVRLLLFTHPLSNIRENIWFLDFLNVENLHTERRFLLLDFFSRHLPPPVRACLKESQGWFLIFCREYLLATTVAGNSGGIPRTTFYNHQEDGHRRRNCPTLTHGSRARKYKHIEKSHLDQLGENVPLISFSAIRQTVQALLIDPVAQRNVLLDAA